MRKRGKFGEEPEEELKPEPIKKQTLDEWIVDLCVVRDCIDGFVSKEVKGYETLFACPVCDRYKRDLWPYQAIPSAKRWGGPYQKYSDTEMFHRKQEREEVVVKMRRGAGRGE